MSDNIPLEIIKAILSQLPVKSLLRFRCVSKSWCSLIDSKDFIKLHLHHFSKTNSNRSLVVDSTQLYYIDLDSFEQLDIGNPRFETHHVVGSCNGLVLVVSNSYNVVLWNPSTRKVNRLPTTPIERSDFDSCKVYFAFGYDSTHDDYKVVRIVQSQGSFSLSLETKIFSLKRNSWKRVDDFIGLLPYRGKKCGIYVDDALAFLPLHTVDEHDGDSETIMALKWGVYLNDALHTVVNHGRNSEVIMAFDLGKEEHYEVPTPNFSGSSRCLSSVEVMEGCLAAVVSWKKNRSEIWVMKEYGVKESWTKLLCFVPQISEPCMNLCPLAYSKSGDEVLLNYDGMCLNWYNLRKKSVTIACVAGLSASFGASPLDPPFHAEVCVGSLVSPCSPTGMTADKQKEDGQGKKGKEIKKKRDNFLSVGFKLKL